MSVLPIQNVSYTKSKMSVLQNPKCQFYITKLNLKKRHERKDAKEKRRKRKKCRMKGFHKMRPNAEGRIMRPAYHYAGLKLYKKN